MSRTPSGLAMIATRPKKGNTKNVKHAVWSACGCYQQKKKEKQKMSRMPSGLAFIANGPKF